MPHKGPLKHPDRPVVIFRRHVLGCTPCQSAVMAGIPGEMCIRGVRLTLNAATEMVKLIELQSRALSGNHGMAYQCPDIHAHGEDWFITARPCIMVAAQDELF